jgi:S1-C subfamily serine protease
VTLDRGVLVAEVIARGPAAAAGLQAGDVILAIGSRNINSVDELTDAVQTHRVGERIAVKVLRRGSELIYNVTLGEMPSE